MDTYTIDRSWYAGNTGYVGNTVKPPSYSLPASQRGAPTDAAW